MTIDWPRIEAANAIIHAFTDFDRNAAPGSGPLSDLTIGIKANIAVAGLPWTGGMGLFRDRIAPADAAIVARLRAAGAAILGSLNMHEAALGATTDNLWFGRTHNPHRIGFTPGGSSGGSGAAVAAGLCDAALGTDTLGSIRIPAAYCGVYGLKPGHDAVDTDGLMFLGRAYDSIGPLARDLDTLERVWRVMCDRTQGTAPFAELLTLHDLGGVAVEPAVGAAYARARDALALPARELRLPATPSAIRVAALVEIGAELIAELGPDREARADLISPELTGILAALEAMTAPPSLVADTRRTLRGAIGQDGVLLMPTAPQAAFAHGGRPPSTQADFTGLANVAGLPAIAIPAGRDESGLPVSVQLVGPPDSEARLIAAARDLEPVLGGAIAPPAL